ncbi:MAG: ATP-binding protein, partial [Spirochaetaceae bacterium]|nr:ATP-binding protein [Spirochaetaceae bacterium]
MADKQKNTYDESKIKTLSSLEHIRLRPGMYIGRLGDGKNSNDGVYILIKEVVDNAIDEFIMGFGNRVDIKQEKNTVRIRDYGRGIPLGKIVECVSVINTGAKYNDDVFQFSVGLNGVGTKAVNALSSDFTVTAFREGKFAKAYFQKGTLIEENKGSTTERNGTLVEFIPDSELFGDYLFNQESLEQRMWNYACLNRNLRLYYNGQKFESKKGLFDLLDSELGSETLYEIGYHQGDKVEFAFTHTNNYGESHFSFVNGQHTSDGGTHLSAFREGFLKGANEFYKKNYSGTDVRDGFCGAIAIKLKDPIFESQTKNRLGNTEIRGWLVNEVKAAVSDFLHKNETSAKSLENKIINNERLRKELNAVKKEAKAAANKISLNIPKLKDCKYHRQDGEKGETTTIFITEGQSATGSMVSCRDVYTQ